MILIDVIKYHQEQGLTSLASCYDDFNTSFSFYSLNNIRSYLNRLPRHLRREPLFGTRYSRDSKFSYDELNYIESISKNNGKFEVSLLEAVLPLRDVSVSWNSEGVSIGLIDKEKERIIRPKWSYANTIFDIEDKWYRDGRYGKELKGEFYASPEFRKRCHDCPEIAFSFPMPIYINAVNPKRPELGFFSLYDDLSILSNLFLVDDDSGDYSDLKLRNFINDLSKMIEGTVYFSFHSHSLTNVINADGLEGSFDQFCCHFFSIREPRSWRTGFTEKMCDAYSMHFITY